MTRVQAFTVALSRIQKMNVQDFDSYLSGTHSKEELTNMSFLEKKNLVKDLEFNYIAQCPEDYLDVVYGDEPVYNVAGDVGFSILTTNPDQPSKEEIIYALERRLEILKNNPDEISEAIGINDIPDESEDQEGVNHWKNKK